MNQLTPESFASQLQDSQEQLTKFLRYPPQYQLEIRDLFEKLTFFLNEHRQKILLVLEKNGQLTPEASLRIETEVNRLISGINNYLVSPNTAYLDNVNRALTQVIHSLK